MTQLLTSEEREEVYNLAAEMELESSARRTYATELIRQRSFIAACRRDVLRLPAKLQRLLAARCPPQLTYDDWRALADARHEPIPEITLKP